MPRTRSLPTISCCSLFPTSRPAKRPVRLCCCPRCLSSIGRASLFISASLFLPAQRDEREVPVSERTRWLHSMHASSRAAAQNVTSSPRVESRRVANHNSNAYSTLLSQPCVGVACPSGREYRDETSGGKERLDAVSLKSSRAGGARIMACSNTLQHAY